MVRSIVAAMHQRQLAANQDINEFFLGVRGAGGQGSYCDVKFYRRRKRWLG